MLEAGLIVSRFLHYVAVLSLFGAALFPLYTYRGRLDAFASDDGPLTVWLRRILVSAILLAFVSAVGWFVFTTGAMAGDISQVTNLAVLNAVMTGTDFGPLWVARFVSIIAIAALLRFWPAKKSMWLVPALAGFLLASLAGTGHARITEGWPGTIHIASDIAHLLAAGWWLGGLLPLGILVFAAPAAGDSRHGDFPLGKVLCRFSGIGTVAVAILIASGVVNSWFLVGSPNALLTSVYGRLLIAKVAIFLIMAAIATANRWWITPQLCRPGSAFTHAWLARLRCHVLAEQALGLCVVVLVSLLGTLQPAVS